MDKQEQIANERAREGIYRRALVEKQSRGLEVGVYASASWTGTGQLRLPRLPDGEIVGRVAVDDAPEVSATGDCYIGSTYFEGHGMVVYSWAAPIARIFYTRAGHPLCEQVRGVRTFTHESSVIADFDDEHRWEGDRGNLFRQRAMHVEGPIEGTALRSLPRPVPTAAVPLPGIGAPESGQSTATREGEQASRETPHTLETRAPESDAPVRARELLERHLQRGRTGQLESVLATLQPDQYSLVTRDGRDRLIIDGHPGTGKTVIAVHRAAYLTSPEYNEDAPDDARIAKVLVVGPTDEYVAHVAPAINTLTRGTARVHVMSLRALLAKATGLQTVAEGQAITRVDDGDAQLWSLAYDAVARLKRTGALVGPRSSNMRDAYDLLRSNGGSTSPITTDDRWAEYLKRLPHFASARQNRVHVPLIAAIGWCVSPSSDLTGFDHVIVDEAQDVMGIEWALLDAVNASERWTLLGDMNQRRSDAAHGSWKYIADALALLDDAGEPPVVRIKRGYRSTAPIMTFANRLLPKHAREVESFQTSGPPVTVVPVGHNDVLPEALRQVHDLANALQGGTIAIIGMERPLTETFLRQQSWDKDAAHEHRWSRRGIAVDVVSPDSARGLEWDGVVVIEPAKFPKNFLRHGLLYTSLTRANRELRVVHSHPLPEPLNEA